ncbi:MAG: polyprenyl synthetase family protein [Fusobacteriaceae bacterium]
MMLDRYMEKSRKEIDKVIEEYFLELEYPGIIAEGMRYSVLNGGKRIRPILLFMTLELLGVDRELGYGSGVAIEMIHSYSLVHDDLPAIDNDDYRRGKLTTHKKFGEAAAILIGDGLLTHAFTILSEKNNKISPEKIVKIIAKTSGYSGINGMLGGQMVDIESEGKTIDFETLKYIHKNKTGKLISLPIEIGCIISEAGDEKTENLKRYGELLGLAFQIRDDILDVEGSFEKLGKPIGSDLELEKSTYPSIFGMDETKKILVSICKEAQEIILKNFPGKTAQIFIELVKYVAERDS